MRCRNGHQASIDGSEAPVYCPTCGIHVREAHPFDLGLVFGIVACIIVSIVEFLSLGYVINTNSDLGSLLLLASIPGVFLMSSGFGAVYLKSRFDNVYGLGRIALGTVPIFIGFLILWSFFLLFLALFLSCGSGEC